MQKDERDSKEAAIARISKLLKKTQNGSKEQKKLLNDLQKFLKGDIPAAKK
ncbi:MAG: hypothetical protein WCC86_07155 [Methanoregula sp.]|uniref:hypothetical protein n=1 Tax=Methanoregula sp. TaxID=2052170 RepID=UPI003BAE610F